MSEPRTPEDNLPPGAEPGRDVPPPRQAPVGEPPPAPYWAPPVPAPGAPMSGAPMPGAPAPGWQQQPQAPWGEPPKRGISTGLVVVLVIVGVLVVAVIGFAVIAASSLGNLTAGRTPIGQVAVGQCFNGLTSDDTSGGTPGMQLALVFGVTVIDCAEPHDGELVGRFDWTDGDSAYPGTDALVDFSERGCRTRFAEYVGTSFDVSVLEMTYTYPLEPQWASGVRSFECIAHAPAAGEQLTESVRNSRR